jgi:hypothetical protein
VGSAYSGLVSSVYFSKHSRVVMGSGDSEVDIVQSKGLVVSAYSRLLVHKERGGGGRDARSTECAPSTVRTS